MMTFVRKVTTGKMCFLIQKSMGRRVSLWLLAGIYNVVVEASVKDSSGVWWRTGPRETIVVKAYDDAARVQQQLAQVPPRSNNNNNRF